MKELCVKAVDGFLSLPKGGQILIGVVVAVLLLIGTGKVLGHTDEAPSTRLLVCKGSLPVVSLRDHADGGCGVVDVSAITPLHGDLVEYAAQQFAHIYWESGDPACVYTLDGNGHASSGRDCRPGSPPQCAYIEWGWRTFAVTGQSCGEAGIDTCGGPGCT